MGPYQKFVFALTGWSASRLFSKSTNVDDIGPGMTLLQWNIIKSISTAAPDVLEIGTVLPLSFEKAMMYYTIMYIRTKWVKVDGYAFKKDAAVLWSWDF